MFLTKKLIYNFKKMLFLNNPGILGQNARNLLYIGQYNDSLAKKLADSKLKTKEFLQSKNINVAENIAVIRNATQLEYFDLDSLPLPFVVKPNKGYGGKGIIIFEKKDEKGNFVSNDNGKTFNKEELKNHIVEILGGFYSLSGLRDKAIFERKIVLDHSIDLLGKYGLPDIRIIVFNSVPVIAMMRIPTENSKGKANIHAGACALGIDISSGKITYITQFRKIIKAIPGIGDVRGLEIPQWEDILKLAVEVQQETKIGYIGCDIVLDDNVGPLLLEMNVRPGLDIQIANKIPLRERLKKVQNIKINSVEKGVRLAIDMFGGYIEEKIKNISGKKVLGNKEFVELLYNNTSYKTICEIKAEKLISYINKTYLLETLKFPSDEIVNNIVKFKCNILGDKKIIRFLVKELERSNIILGKDALNGFLLDPYKYRDNDSPIDIKNPLIKEKNIVILKSYEEHLLKVDKEIMDIDKKLNILKLISPKNIVSERLKFINSLGKYIPKLEYNNFKYDIKELYNSVKKVEIPEVPLGVLYRNKKQEIIHKIYFIEAFLAQDIEKLNKYSTLLYGEVKDENYMYALKILEGIKKMKGESSFLTTDEIKEEIERYNHIYGFNIIFLEKEIVSRMQMKGNKLLLKSGTRIGKREKRAIFAHEIETHYLRKLNGLGTKFKLFSSGTAGYNLYEEGLAIYNQTKFLTQKDKKYYSSALRYHFIDFAKKHNYNELIEELKKFYKEDYSTIYTLLVRLKRGLKNIEKDYCFKKDLIYLNGYIEINDYAKNGGNLKELYFGKIGIKDIEEIRNIEFIDFKIENFKVPVFY